MIIEYQPNKGFSINSINLQWGETRESVRQKFNYEYKADDHTIEVAKYFNDGSFDDIEQKRDIYQDIDSEKNYFFFNYNKQNQLDSVELHWGFRFHIQTKSIEYNQNLDDCINELKNLDSEYSEVEQGSHLFKNLLLTISSSEEMGGDGKGLAYVYISNNINHLLEQ